MKRIVDFDIICKCGNEVLTHYEDGKVKLRTNIIIWEGTRAICKCLRCKNDILIPVKLGLNKDIKHILIKE